MWTPTITNSSTIKWVLLAIVWALLLPAVYDVIVNFWGATATFAAESWPEKAYPIANFVTRAMTILILLLLLFTPGNIESPIHYFASKTSEKLQLFFNFNLWQEADKAGFSERAPILNAAILEFLFLTVVTSIYYFLVRKMNTIDSSYLAMLIFLFFVFIIISVNSYAVRTLSLGDDMLKGGNTNLVWNTTSYINHKIVVILVMIIGTIILIAWGDAASVWLADTIWEWNLPIVNWFAEPVYSGWGLPSQ